MRYKKSPLDFARVRAKIASRLLGPLPRMARPEADGAFQCVVPFPNFTGRFRSARELGGGFAVSKSYPYQPKLPHLFPQLTGGVCYPSARSLPLVPSWVSADHHRQLIWTKG